LNTLKRPKIPTVHAALAGAVCAAAVLLSGLAQAQTIYRIVSPDGRVTFSDQQPAAGENATALGSGGRLGAASSASLPLELRQVAGKFPVTLYTAANCVPCGQGRELLGGRGIPFSERIVGTPADSAALQRISGDTSLPFLTIGGQQIKGFSSSEWNQFLDAAGYPGSSVLPASYRNPLPTPLVAVQPAAPTPRQEDSQKQNPAAGSSPPASDSAANPAGIKF
jgi:glutaredoxin